MPVLSELRTPITSLTDGSGGSAGDTIPDAPATYVEGDNADSLASLSAKVNAILVTLRKWKMLGT